MEENANKNLSEKFSDLAAIKKQQAAEYQAKEKAERDKNNILMRWRAIRNGSVMEDDSTQAELELYASVDDISQLALDENGHICLLSSLQQSEKDEDISTDSSADNDAIAEAAAQRRKDALTAALSVSNQDGAKPETDADAKNEGDSLPDSDGEDDIPVADGARVLRVENLGVNEARVFIATRYNPDTQEAAYGLCVEQGYGETRQAFLQGERAYNTTAKSMAFRAATAALTPYGRLGQPVRRVTIYMDRDLGWVLMQNSWSLVTEAYTLDAEAYCQAFKACAGRDVNIRFAPAESSADGQKQANEMVEKLIHTPA